MSDSPLFIVLTVALGLWFVAGVVLSMRAEVRTARTEGRSAWRGGIRGMLLAVPPEVYVAGLVLLVAGLALLGIAVWQAI